MCKVSIIVTAYNAEKFISNCLESCVNQTCLNTEIIVVDDGSVDKTSVVVTDFSNNDPRVRLITKKNEGLVEARKTGVSNAKGEFVFFIDADDYIENNTIEELLKYDDYDIIIGGIVIESNNGSTNYIQHTNRFKFDMTRCGIYANYLSKDITASLCGRLIRKNLILGFDTPSEMTIGEDVITNFIILKSDDIKIKLVERQFYHYVQYPTSMVNKKSNLRLDKRILYVNWIVNHLKCNNLLNNSLIMKTLPYFVMSEYYTYLRDGGSPDYNPTFYRDVILSFTDERVIKLLPFWQRMMINIFSYSSTAGRIYRFVFLKLRSLIK